MKLSTFIIAVAIAAALAFYFGRSHEKAVSVQTDVNDLKNRVSSLEEANARRAQNWKCAKTVASIVPGLGKFLDRF